MAPRAGPSPRVLAWMLDAAAAAGLDGVARAVAGAASSSSPPSPPSSSSRAGPARLVAQWLAEALRRGDLRRGAAALGGPLLDALADAFRGRLGARAARLLARLSAELRRLDVLLPLRAAGAAGAGAGATVGAAAVSEAVQRLDHLFPRGDPEARRGPAAEVRRDLAALLATLTRRLNKTTRRRGPAAEPAVPAPASYLRTHDGGRAEAAAAGLLAALAAREGGAGERDAPLLVRASREGRALEDAVAALVRVVPPRKRAPPPAARRGEPPAKRPRPAASSDDDDDSSDGFEVRPARRRRSSNDGDDDDDDDTLTGAELWAVFESLPGAGATRADRHAAWLGVYRGTDPAVRDWLASEQP
jgi:hypothetical protein